MKLADRIIDLMAPFPGREFKMQEIVNYLDPRASRNDARDAVRKQAIRVLAGLEESGTVMIIPPKKRGQPARFIWK